MFETSLLRDKRILVTGGGSGLGAAMGRHFLTLGAEFLICGRRLDRLDAAAAEMRAQTGGKVTTIACDIRDGAAVDGMMDQIWREAPLESSSTTLPRPSSRRASVSHSVRRTRSSRRRCMARCIARSQRAGAGSKPGRAASCSPSSRPRPSQAAPSPFPPRWRIGRAGDGQKPCGGMGAEDLLR
jgi:hypothetical protein